MFKKMLIAVPAVCFSASILVWADADVSKPQDDPSPAPDAVAEPAAESQGTLPSVAVTEPVSQWGRHRHTQSIPSANWDGGLAYDSAGIDQTVRWVDAQGNHWAVQIDDVIAAGNLKIATTQDTAMASLSDEQINAGWGWRSVRGLNQAHGNNE